jgi:hypothetical protein
MAACLEKTTGEIAYLHQFFMSAFAFLTLSTEN